jgi:hypothetical protein
MKKTILNFMLAGAMCLGTGLPAFAQASGGADQAFARYDADKDGKLNVAELAKLTTPDGKKASMEDWDADGDGSVSKAEFAAKYAAAHPGSDAGKSQPAQPKR